VCACDGLYVFLSGNKGMMVAALTCPSGSSVCACSPSSGTSFGTISDGPSNYQPSVGISNCQWLIASTGNVFSLRFTFFEVETFVGGYGDYVDIRRCKTSACTVACAPCLESASSMSHVSCLKLPPHTRVLYVLMLPLCTSRASLHVIQIHLTVV
jgi:hypothetical protein